MQVHGNASKRPPRLLLGMTTTAALAVTLAACSGSGSPAASGNTAPPAKTTQASPAATTPASSAPASAAAATGLTGTWSGQYGGGYQGTFHLTWHQSGSKLTGTIRLSAPATTLPIDGTVTGGDIRFGTLGSLAITYSGTVSGTSMSGSYQVHVNGSTGGSWSASKSS